MAWDYMATSRTLTALQLDDDVKWQIKNVTINDFTPTTAQVQVNKLFAIAGKAIRLDENMKRTTTEEAVENG